MAAALVYGKKALIGPLFCSFVYLAVIITPSYTATALYSSTTIALVMTILNALRVWILVWLCDRFLGRDQLSLDSPKQMIQLLIIAGPIGGTLGTLTVLPTIFTVSDLDPAFRLALTARWWLAMTTGGMIFTPLLLKLLQKPAEDRLPRRIYLLTSLSAIGLLFGMIWFIRAEINNDIVQGQLSTKLELTNNLAQQFREVEDIANSLTAAIVIKPELTDDDFGYLTTLLQRKKSGIIGFLSWSPMVTHKDRANFEQNQRCYIKELQDSRLVPRQPYALYIPVTYLFPRQGANQVLCFDLLSETRREQAILQAIRDRKPTLTEPIPLANEAGPGVLMVTPVFHQNGNFLGVIAIVIIIDDVVTQINQSFVDRATTISFDFVSPKQATLALGRPTLPAKITTQSFDIQLFDQTWKVTWRPTSTDLQRLFNWQINLFSTIGSFIVILIQFIAYRLVLMNKLVKSEVASQTELLEAAKKSAELAATTKGQFLANMSHEIRTPLNAILGFAELAKTETNEQQKREYINGIWSSSEALLSLVNDILDYSKIEAGKLEIHESQFTIDQIAQRLSAIFAIQIQNKGLGFSLTCDDSQLPLFADDARIHQILLNLCSNAVKFTKEGRIDISLTLHDRLADQATLVAAVTDTGIGMSAEEQLNVFEEFTQADASISRKFGGTGLGLAISYTLTRLLGGSLILDSTPNVGTRFELRVPVSIAQQRRATPEKQKSLTGFNLLLVDDNPINLKVTSALLVRSGFKVRTANNGLEAIASIQADCPDLVFMDMQMPELDGLETTERLRQLYAMNELIIVGLTANAATEDRDKCLAAGMNDHLAKPISVEKLSSCLTKWLS